MFSGLDVHQRGINRGSEDINRRLERCVEIIQAMEGPVAKADGLLKVLQLRPEDTSVCNTDLEGLIAESRGWDISSEQREAVEAQVKC